MFQGFSQQTGDFIWSLAMNNDRTWFMEHKQEFEAVFNQPFRALADETLALMRQRWPEQELQLHVSRIYRDARRLFGRGPFKDHLWFTLQSGSRHSVGPVFWFELDGMSWSYGTGCWDEAADMAEAFRAAIDADPAAFERLVLGLPDGYRLWGEEYKRLKGDRGDVINPWYNRKHHSVGFERGYGGVLYTDALPRFLADAFSELMPFYRFFREVHQRTEARRAALREQSIRGE